jgi:MFS family permease
MFLILVPISLITMVAALVLIDNSVLRHRQTKIARKFDWGGALLSAPAVIILITMINNPFNLSFFSLAFVGGLAAVALLLGAFCLWELRSSSPMLELRIFRNLTFATSVGARALGFMAATTIQLLPPILLISVKGLSARSAGLILVLNFLGMAVASTIAGRLSDRFRPKPFALFGFTLLVISTLWMSFATTTTSLWFLMGALLLHGLAMGFWNVPNQALLMGSLPQSSLGIGGAFSNLTRNVGNVTGQAIVTAIVVGIMMADGFDIPLSEIANTEGSGRAFINGWKITFWLAAALSVAGLITTLITKSTSPTKLPVFSNLDSIQQSVPETKIPTESSSSAVKPSTILISIPLVITLILALDWFWKKKSNRNE